MRRAGSSAQRAAAAAIKSTKASQRVAVRSLGRFAALAGRLRSALSTPLAPLSRVVQAQHTAAAGAGLGGTQQHQSDIQVRTWVFFLYFLLPSAFARSFSSAFRFFCTLHPHLTQATLKSSVGAQTATSTSFSKDDVLQKDTVRATMPFPR